MKFLERYKKLDSMQKEVSNFEVNSEVEVTMTKAICEVGSVSLHFMRAPDTYQNDRGMKMLFHTSGVEIIGLFLRVSQSLKVEK